MDQYMIEYLTSKALRSLPMEGGEPNERYLQKTRH